LRNFAIELKIELTIASNCATRFVEMDQIDEVDSETDRCRNSRSLSLSLSLSPAPPAAGVRNARNPFYTSHDAAWKGSVRAIYRQPDNPATIRRAERSLFARGVV